MGISQDTHESMAIDAANYLCHQLEHLLAPISSAISQSGPWEERSAMVRLTQKLQKAKRNKRWRKRKRKHVAELFQKVALNSSWFFESLIIYTFVKALLKISRKSNSLVSMFHRSVQIMTELIRKLMNGELSK